MAENDPMQQELLDVERRLQDLQEYRVMLSQVLVMRTQVLATGSGAHPGEAAPPEWNTPFLDDREQFHVNSLEMAVQVLRNASAPTLEYSTLRQEIRKLYGVDAADSLLQLLTRKAKQCRIFYKAENGEFGLLERRLRSHLPGQILIERVSIGSSAAA